MRFWATFNRSSFTALWMTLGVCASPGALASSSDAMLRELAASVGVTGELGKASKALPPNSPTVRLGAELFFSRSLSLGRDVACASCHHPLLGGADAMSLSIGIGATDPELVGPGREFNWRGMQGADPHSQPGPNIPRNSPTLFNVGHYKRVLFHDGRIERMRRGEFRTPESRRDAGSDLLSVQARFPLTSEAEMRGFRSLRHASSDRVRNDIIERLRDERANRWTTAFAEAFGDNETRSSSVSLERLERALSDYQRSLEFLDSPWVGFLRGDDDAIDDAAKRGARLFFTSADAGGVGCTGCHSGDHFTDEQFHALGVPALGRGLVRPAAGYGKDTIQDGTDFGRWEVTRRDSDRYAFRTPSLLNTTLTAPYGHSGAFATLEAVIRHHAEPATSVDDFDFKFAHLAGFGLVDGQYPSARNHSKDAAAHATSKPAVPRALSVAEISDLVAFLHTLTDPCAADALCLAPWIPNAEQPSPDGARLQARFELR